MPTRRPITAPRPVIAATATLSGWHCVRLVMSITQEEIASGRKSGSNGATRGNPLGSGFGSGHSEKRLPPVLSKLSKPSETEASALGCQSGSASTISSSLSHVPPPFSNQSVTSPPSGHCGHTVARSTMRMCLMPQAWAILAFFCPCARPGASLSVRMTNRRPVNCLR
jgi:hypothetical protein